jgi:hypothetical protein
MHRLSLWRENLTLFFFFLHCLPSFYLCFFSFMPSPFILSPVLLFRSFYLSVLSPFLSPSFPCFVSKSLHHLTTNAICQTLRVITLASYSYSSSFFFPFNSLLVSSFYLLRFSSSSSTRPSFLIHSSQIHHSLSVY